MTTDLAEWLEPNEPNVDEYTPELVLATFQELPFKADAGFSEYMPQTGGLLCNHPKFWAKPLEMTPDGKELAELLARKFWESNIMAPANLYDITEYEGVLRRYGQTCANTYEPFEEAIYPMDWGEQVAQIAVVKDLPKSLDEFVNWQHEFSKFGGIMRRWWIAILTENSD